MKQIRLIKNFLGKFFSARPCWAFGFTIETSTLEYLKMLSNVLLMGYKTSKQQNVLLKSKMHIDLRWFFVGLPQKTRWVFRISTRETGYPNPALNELL